MGTLGLAKALLGVLALLAAACSLMVAGCTRGFYRQQADVEAYEMVQEKAYHPHWALDSYTIEVDPRSRMFDPFDPDLPPMPPDDPAAHQLMHFVDGKRGWPHWDRYGYTQHVENPVWQQYLPLADDGVLTIDADESVRLALLHSPDYQRQLETLYLAALDVSTERFRFDTQFFGGYSAFFTADGPARPGGPGRPQSVLDLSTQSLGRRPIAAQRAFTTGADLVVGMANSLVWQFAGPDVHTTTTLLDFSLFQPLLRQAGRARFMERLTISERALLANVRQMERFRRGFYMNVTTGRPTGPGPSRRGGFFGAPGLDGFTGVGGGGFGAIGRVGGLGIGVVGAGAVGAGGYLGLLQEQQNIRNEEANVAALRSSLSLLEAFFEAGRIDFLQVEQARESLFSSQSRLVSSKISYQNAVDNFKRTLGLPPHLDVRIEDPLLEPFNLIDPELVPVQNQAADIQQQVGRTVMQVLPVDDQPLPAWPQQAARLGQLAEYLARTEALRQQVQAVNVQRAEQDIARLRAALPRRREDLEVLRRKVQSALAVPHPVALDPGKGLSPLDFEAALFDIEGLERLPDELEQMLAMLLVRLEQDAQQADALAEEIEALIEEGQELETEPFVERFRTAVFAPLTVTLSEFSANVLELSLIQARARTESITLGQVEMEPDWALELARTYRRDWMNARATLVDTWRLIEFNANDLESSVDVVFSGDISNAGNNPVKLQGTTGRLRAGLQFDAPLTRLIERNTYRQALIEFQQAKRSYYEIEDAISQILRATLRQIELNQVNFELNRAGVQVAIRQVEVARLRLQEPPRPDEVLFGPTTARDLVSALSALVRAQNDFLSIWVNYEVQRRNLDLDLGTMQLDPQGLWLDPGPIGPDYGLPLDDHSPDLFPLHPAIRPLPAEAEVVAPGQLDLAPPPPPQFLPAPVIDEDG